MAIEALFADGMTHVGAGIALSLLDFITSKIANPKTARLERKKHCLRSIEILLDSETPAASPDVEDPSSSLSKDDPPEETHESPPAVRTVPKDSVQYAEHVNTVRDYLRSSGIVKLQLPFGEKVKYGIRNLIFHEKINNLSHLQKLGVAFGIEVLYDTVIGFHHYTAVLKKSPVAAITVNLYQIPAFWAGLWLGNGIKKFLNLLITPGNEKKLDRALRQLLQETKIVEIVMHYQPPEQVRKSLTAQGIEMYTAHLTRVGQGAFKHLKQLAATAKDTADSVINFSQKQQEKDDHEQEERRKRFDELTKGR